MELPHYGWLCPQCNFNIDALSESGLEIKRRLHLEAHHRVWIGKSVYDHIIWFKGRAAVDPYNPSGDWCDWDDVDYLLSMKIDPSIVDDRSDEVLAARYKQEADGGPEKAKG